MQFTKLLLWPFFFFLSIALAEASPFREGDESSVDIYDGLDSSLSVSGRLIVSHCLAWNMIESLLLRLISSKTIFSFSFTFSWYNLCFSEQLI